MRAINLTTWSFLNNVIPMLEKQCRLTPDHAAKLLSTMEERQSY
jgi:hypothetical protein